ncbi:hypothetical protein H6G00_05000 [Leptolyngbya sp. FACHB-541]|uniref:hypothetical protein n=1 Tax=Leptolyngbya sp. FACHB-541 TaxID=2692810 RepID=UPI0016896334|nr:hypothetical protein [Leptolyngbya sp. FACHB-541]MBD1995973.1 hypothetical protein [Leptolyngbya sp. FACHB-541]
MSSHYGVVESTANREMNLNEVPDRQTSVNDVEMPVQGLWAAPVVLIALAGIVLALRRSLIWKLTHSYVPPSPKLKQLPCSNCRFFGSNPYLKCAVHPDKALKAEAMTCSDYWAQDSDRFSR